MVRTLHQTFRGPHFTLIALGDGASEAAAALAWPGVGAELVRVAIPQPLRGMREIYAFAGPTQILVRPDGYRVNRQCRRRV